jgi:hypothetical protein
MTKIRKGKRQVDDIFSGPARTATAPAAVDEAPAPAAHNRHAEPYAKVTAVLFERQVSYLDRLALDMARKPGRWSRTEILRALVDGLERSELDVTGADSEEALAELVAKRLGGGK